MARKNNKTVQPSMRKKDSGHCGTITVADHLRFERSARREEDIARGHSAGHTGCGVQGGTKRANHRRDRQAGKLSVRRWRDDL